MNPDATAVIVTARSRPAYLRQVLASWERARGLDRLHSFTIALGVDDGAWMSQLRVIDSFRAASGLGAKVRLKVDSDAARRSNGMHRAIGEAADHVLADPAAGFVVFGEEDIAVSADVLEYMSWAREKLAADGSVLAVCAHSQGGAGWDRREPADDADADQEAVRLLPYFNPWVWGTWRDRWEQVIRPTWDWECSKGPRPDQMGYDWGLYHMTQQEGYACAVPDASRSQNIGRHGGWASNEETWSFSQAASFRLEREPVQYQLIPHGKNAENAA